MSIIRRLAFPRWHKGCFYRVMRQNFLLAASGALFLGGAGAFFLFVPLMSIATVVLMLGGLMLMYCLGFQAGGQELVPSKTVDELDVTS